MTKRLVIYITVRMIATIILLIVHCKNGTMKYAKERGKLLSVILTDCIAFEPLIITLVILFIMSITDEITNGSNIIFDYSEEREMDRKFRNKEDEI